MPTSRETDDGARENDTCSGDGTEDGLDRHGLGHEFFINPFDSQLTSFFSMGVPSMGTSVLTGKDSGCSGILHVRRAQDILQIRRHTWRPRG